MTSGLWGSDLEVGGKGTAVFLVERAINGRGKFFPVWEMTRVGYGTASFGEYRGPWGLDILAVES
jgi:hypothetical protein